MSIDFKSINRHRGDFTKKANSAGMGVQEYARHVLADTGNYDTRTVRQASFAKAATKFKHHALGGNLYPDGGEKDGYKTPYRSVSRIAHDVAQNSAADFVARLNDAGRMTIPDYEHPDAVATHKMASAVLGVDGRRRGVVFPTVQNIDGRLVDFNDPANESYGDPLKSALERGDYFLTPGGRSARRFAADRYKAYFPSGKGFACGGMRRFDDGGNMVEYDEEKPPIWDGYVNQGQPRYSLQVPGKYDDVKIDFMSFVPDKVNGKTRPYYPENMMRIQDALVAANVPYNVRVAILSTILQESGGDPSAKSGSGKYRGIIQWDKRRMPDRYVGDLDWQIKKIVDDINDVEAKEWTDGGKGGPKIESAKRGREMLFEAGSPYDATVIFNKGYVRPKNQESWYNRARQADKVDDVLGKWNANDNEDGPAPGMWGIERAGRGYGYEPSGPVPGEPVPGARAYGGLVRPYADGGELAHTHGSWWSSGLQYVDEGGSHEQNPYEGVRMGVDGQGTPNLVEEGEVIYNGYVFSNRFGPTADELQSAGLPASYAGSSYALIAEKMGRDVALRPNDAISRRGLEANMSRLMGLQEAYREAHGMNADAGMPGMDGEAMDEAAQGPALPYGMEAPPEGQDEGQGQAPEEEMMRGQGSGLEYPDMGGGMPFMGAYGGRMPRLYRGGGRKDFADFLNKIDEYKRPEGYVQIDDGGWMTKDDAGNDVSVDYDEDAAINKWAQEIAEGVDWGSFKRSGISSAIAGLTEGKQENPTAMAALKNALNSSYAQYRKDSSGWDRFGQAIGVSPDENGMYKTGMRYAPMLANAGNAIYNLAKRPDMREARAYEDIARNITAPQVRAGQLGEHMPYSPIDVNRALNAARASAGATRRSMTGLNAGQANALNLAAGYNEQRAVGQTMADIYKQNLDMRKAVSEFNRMTNATNIQNDMAAQTTNAANRAAADQRREALLTTAAKTRSAERSDLSRARLESVGKVATDLGALGRENLAYNQARTNPALHGYWTDKNGGMHYSGTLDEASVDPMLLMMLKSDPGSLAGKQIEVRGEMLYIHPVYDEKGEVKGVDFKTSPYVPSGNET